MNILLRTRSVATDLVTSQNFNQNAVLLCCVNLDEHATSTWPPDSFSSLVLRRAVLQAAT